MDLDQLTIDEIKQLIKDGVITNKAVIEYYANEWWDEVPQ